MSIKKCPECGEEYDAMYLPHSCKEKNEKQSENSLIALFNWKMDEEELKNQVKNYDARKVATVGMIFVAIITLIFVMVGWYSSTSWVDIVLILILVPFVYKGKSWAMIATMIYWTFNEGYQLVNNFSVENFSVVNVTMPVIFWAIFMKLLWQAYQVERERKKIKK